MAQIIDIRNQLTRLGLLEPETQVYMTLYSKGPLSVLHLSQACKIPRTTTYRLCESLREKRFVEIIIGEHGQIYKCIEPSRLNYLVTEKAQTLLDQQRALAVLQTLLPSTTPVKSAHTEVRYYKGKEGIRQTMWNATKAENGIIGYTIYGRAQIAGRRFVDEFINECLRKGIQDRTVINETGLEYLKQNPPKGKVHRSQAYEDIRFLPASKIFIKGDITIYNNIYCISFWEDGEVAAVEIENPYFVANQRSIFEILWEIAEPIQNLMCQTD